MKLSSCVRLVNLLSTGNSNRQPNKMAGTESKVKIKYKHTGICISDNYCIQAVDRQFYNYTIKFLF